MADKNVFANAGPSKPDVETSIFDLSHAYNGTFRIGRAYPCFVFDAPGKSSFRIKLNSAMDVQPMLFPIQTPVRQHISFFKIPKRILMKSWKDFECRVGDHKVPWIARPSGWATTGSLADYMGIPTEKAAIETNEGGQFTWSRVNNAGSYQTFGHSPSISWTRLMFPTTMDVSTQAVTSSRLTDEILRTDALFKFTIVSATPVTVAGHSISQFVGKSLFFHLLNDINENPRHRFEVYYNLSLSYVACASLSDFDELTGWTCPIDEIEEVDTGFVSSNDIPVTYNRFNIYFRPTAEFVTWFNRMVTNPNFYTRLCMRWDNVLWPWFGTETRSIDRETNSVDMDYTLVGDYSTTEDEPIVTKGNIVSHLSLKTFGIERDCLYKGQVAKMTNDTSIFSTDNVLTPPKLPINALSFRAYEFIHNYFFRNTRVTPFMKDGEIAYNEYLTNDGDGADDTTPVSFFNVPYEYDLFTTCVPTPQAGNAPLVGITTNNAGKSAIFHMQPVDGDGEPDGDPYDIAVSTDGQGNIMGISNYEEVADKTSVMRLKEAIDFGISINDFRNANCMQRYEERFMKANAGGSLYRNLYYEFYGTRPPIGEEFPEYIGGNTSVMNVGKIVNQTGSNDTETKLGEFAGVANFRSRSRGIKCFCDEACYIMGIMWFSATPTYSQMLPRHFTKFDRLEFHNPQFNNIGLQPVYAHQIAPLQLTDEELTEVFGYNRPFSEYVSMQDEVHGQFRTTMANFLMQRIFGSRPRLNEDFLYIKSEDLTDVFSVNENDDKIFGQIWFDVKAKLPIPRFAIPRII